jgi:hypothetical protein
VLFAPLGAFMRDCRRLGSMTCCRGAPGRGNIPESFACSAVTFSYPGGLISHCVNRLLLSVMGTTSVRSGVGSFFFGGGESAFAAPRCIANSSRSLPPPPRPPPLPSRLSKPSLSPLGGRRSSSSRLASRRCIPLSPLSPRSARSLFQSRSSRGSRFE